MFVPFSLPRTVIPLKPASLLSLEAVPSGPPSWAGIGLWDALRVPGLLTMLGKPCLLPEAGAHRDPEAGGQGPL